MKIDSQLDQLKTRLAENPRQVVAVLGAGVSIASAPNYKDVLSWVGLLKNGSKQCPDLDRKSEIDDLWMDYDKCSQAGRGSLLIGIADKLVHGFGGQESDKFEKWIKGVFGNIEYDSNEEELVQALMDMDVPLLTTNYDTIVEKILDYPSVNIEERHQVESVIAGDEKGIIHLHGMWTNPKRIVLDWNSYREAKEDYFLQYLQDQASMGRNLLFVGFGSGIYDPNFSSWIERIFKTIPDSYYNKYMLITKGQSDIPKGIIPLCYGNEGEYAKLPAFLRSLMPQDGSPQQMRRLSRAPVCFGRDTEIDQLVSSLIKENGSQSIIYGPAGIGKGTMALKSLHKTAVKNRFKKRRFSIGCNEITTYSTLLFRIAHLLDVPGELDLYKLRNSILSELKRKPTALLLDNFETIWKDEDSGEMKELLNRLAIVDKLALLVTYRGIPPFIDIKWTYNCKLPQISFPHDREMFLRRAGQKFANDPSLRNLLDAMDGVPLAIELIAHLAAGETTLAGLFEQWNKHKTDLLQQGKGETPNESWSVSLGLTLANRRMQSFERTLLSCIAFLPDGVSRKYLEERLPYSSSSIDALIELGLVEITEDDWLWLLAPIREHVKKHFSLDSQEMELLTNAIISYAENNCREIGSKEGLLAVQKIRPIMANIEASIQFGLKGQNWMKAAQATQKLTAAFTLAGIGDQHLLDCAYEKAKTEAATNVNQKLCLLVAKLRRAQGKIAEQSSELDKAEAIYQEVAEHFIPTLSGIGRKRLEARIKKDLADVALAKGETDPTTLYVQARHLLSNPDVGFPWHPIACDLGQAAAALKQDLEILKGGGQRAAKAKIQEARKKFERILKTSSDDANSDFRRIKGKCYQLLAEVAEALRADHWTLHHLIDALIELGPTGDIKNCSDCILDIINLIAESETDEKLFQEYIENPELMAVSGSIRKVELLTFGHLHMHFGKEMESNYYSESILAAKFHYRAAKEFWKKANEPHLVLQAEDGLKRLALLLPSK
jgi:tetratricopeptide (TPR) repeat protein